MIQTVSFSTFRDAFRNCRPSNFSYDALEILFDYFEHAEACSGQQIELDVIAICCEFREAYYNEIADDYGIDILTGGMTIEEGQAVVIQYLNENSILCGKTPAGTFVYCTAF